MPHLESLMPCRVRVLEEVFWDHQWLGYFYDLWRGGGLKPQTRSRLMVYLGRWHLPEGSLLLMTRGRCISVTRRQSWWQSDSENWGWTFVFLRLNHWRIETLNSSPSLRLLPSVEVRCRSHVRERPFYPFDKGLEIGDKTTYRTLFTSQGCWAAKSSFAHFNND